MIHSFWRTFAVGTRYLNIFSGESDSIGTSPNFLVPRACTIYEGTLNGNAPGAGDSFNYQFFQGYSSPSATGNTVTVSGTDTANRTTVTGTLQVADSDVDTSANHLKWTVGGTPTQTENLMAISVEDSSDSSISYHGFGSYSDNILSGKTAATDYYTTFGIGGTATVTTTEANVKLVWPSSGTFKYCAIVYSIGAGSGDVTLKMRINGADSGFSYTFSATGGTRTLDLDTTTTASITAGQTVGWRMQQAATAGSFTCCLVLGFIVD